MLQVNGTEIRSITSYYGGISVIVLGDFHQFPRVARPLRDALYYPVDLSNDSLSSQIGRVIYEEFTTVVELKEQRRISGPVWHDFLQHLRRGWWNFLPCLGVMQH